ncbi:MAG: sigma-70 family RNA polymerase sigma factor [Sphingobacterium sp.]|jgi:RNA polymerase sigma-70 factor (ECF subfamily)|nr:sigma-70 family RNA polymerase sigma factor [Sphingobacterium sp.]
MLQLESHINALKEGHENALYFFMDHFGHALRYFAFSYLRSKTDAEEIVSDIFVKLWNNRQKVDNYESLKAFLYIATKNACIDMKRSTRFKMQTEELDILQNLSIPEDDILKKIFRTELTELLLIEIDKLPRQQAEISKLSFLEGWNTEEICQALDTTPSNVYYARSKALLALKERFKSKNFEYLLLISMSIIHVFKN